MLIELLKQNSGTVSIETFMEVALYHLEYGYYSRGIRGLGRKGDFSTTATFHPALGQAIAHWLMASRKTLFPRGTYHVIEVGGGDGSLASAVLENLSWWQRKALHYHLVEISGSLRQQQKELLQDYRVSWHETMSKALSAASGRALIFSNELVDAFPCLQLIRQEGQWKEVCLTLRDGMLYEENFENNTNLQRAAVSTVLVDGNDLREGQRCEIHVSYRDWLSSWLPLWQEGLLLTIDYGDTFPTLYNNRFHGTLRGYYQHVRMEGHEIYQRFCKQDLTADVNFSDLMNWGSQLGLHNHSYTTQRDFMLQWQPAFANLEKEDPALAFVMHPEGLGTDFKVLLQSPMETGR